ncbi:ion transporter [Candidatus Marinamargulisbacteria bacterium SCGC AG-343-D04]|nr:ion transporter [Candidatus Marinamargulisbacteria bacterium SCGC AG-343-D04]
MSFKRKLHDIVFNTNCRIGQAFDTSIIILIIISTISISISSIKTYHLSYGQLFYTLEWILTILFTIEYVLRLYSSKNRVAYSTSFFGIVDLLAILPTYIALVMTSSHYLLFIRLLRVMRIFRVLKLFKYVSEMQLIIQTLAKSSRKILVFLMMVLVLITLLGSTMYIIEGEEHGFSNIPVSIYWAIVTLTTVGYGDISPQTALGKLVSSIIMILGYCIIAVPTGLVSVDLSKNFSNSPSTPSTQKSSQNN